MIALLVSTRTMKTLSKIDLSVFTRLSILASQRKHADENRNVFLVGINAFIIVYYCEFIKYLDKSLEI